MRNKLLSVFAASALLATTACSTSGSVTTFNTTELNTDAQAIAYAAQVLETMPSVEAHMSTADQATFNNAIAQIKSITATIQANTNGSVEVNTGKEWAKSLGDDLNVLLTIATPIVQAYAPSEASYVSTVQEMLPLIEALAGISSVGVVGSHSVEPPAVVRARIYQH